MDSGQNDGRSRRRRRIRLRILMHIRLRNGQGLPLRHPSLISALSALEKAQKIFLRSVSSAYLETRSLMPELLPRRGQTLACQPGNGRRKSGGQLPVFDKRVKKCLKSLGVKQMEAAGRRSFRAARMPRADPRMPTGRRTQNVGGATPRLSRVNRSRLIRFNGRAPVYFHVRRGTDGNLIVTFWAYADRNSEDDAGAADGAERGGNDEN